MGEVGAAASGAGAEPARPRRFSINALLDGFFFVYAGIAAVWLAWLVFTESFTFGWWGIAFFVVSMVFVYRSFYGMRIERAA